MVSTVIIWVSASRYSNRTITKAETQGKYTLIKQSNSSSRLGKACNSAVDNKFENRWEAKVWILTCRINASLEFTISSCIAGCSCGHNLSLVLLWQHRICIDDKMLVPHKLSSCCEIDSLIDYAIISMLLAVCIRSDWYFVAFNELRSGSQLSQQSGLDRQPSRGDGDTPHGSGNTVQQQEPLPLMKMSQPPEVQWPVYMMAICIVCTTTVQHTHTYAHIHVCTHTDAKCLW